MALPPTQVPQDEVLSKGGVAGVSARRQEFRDWTVALLAGGVLLLIIIVTIWDLTLLSSAQLPINSVQVDPQAWAAAQRAIIDANNDRVAKLFGEIVVKGLLPAFLALSGFFAGAHGRN